MMNSTANAAANAFSNLNISTNTETKQRSSMRAFVPETKPNSSNSNSNNTRTAIYQRHTNETNGASGASKLHGDSSKVVSLITTLVKKSLFDRSSEVSLFRKLERSDWFSIA